MVKRIKRKIVHDIKISKTLLIVLPIFLDLWWYFSDRILFRCNRLFFLWIKIQLRYARYYNQVPPCFQDSLVPGCASDSNLKYIDVPQGCQHVLLSIKYRKQDKVNTTQKTLVFYFSAFHMSHYGSSWVKTLLKNSIFTRKKNRVLKHLELLIRSKMNFLYSWTIRTVIAEYQKSQNTVVWHFLR